MMTKRARLLFCHVFLPFCLLFLFVVNVSMPTSDFSAFSSGLVALTLAVACGISAMASAAIALRLKRADDANSAWWILTTFVLLMTVAGFLRIS